MSISQCPSSFNICIYVSMEKMSSRFQRKVAVFQGKGENPSELEECGLGLEKYHSMWIAVGGWE